MYLLINHVLKASLFVLGKPSCFKNKSVFSQLTMPYICPMSLFFSLLSFAVSNWMGLMGSTNHFRSWMRYCFSHFILPWCIKPYTTELKYSFIILLFYRISLYRMSVHSRRMGSTEKSNILWYYIVNR